MDVGLEAVFFHSVWVGRQPTGLGITQPLPTRRHAPASRHTHMNFKGTCYSSWHQQLALTLQIRRRQGITDLRPFL